MNKDPRIKDALLSLHGLSVGDAFGELFFNPRNYRGIPQRELPPAPWYWTDDTNMALTIVESLSKYGKIDQDFLAKSFVNRFIDNFFRSYGGGAVQLLVQIGKGIDWRIASPQLFGGGSYGNGSAMRIAPLGAYFKDDYEMLISEAVKSAEVTHAHPEGKAGVLATAIAAAITAKKGVVEANDFFDEVIEFTPESEVRNGIITAKKIPRGKITEAAGILGSGYRVICQDTVPFSLWIAAHYMDNYEEALWNTALGKGDVDTTCAIVGGIVIHSSKSFPSEWLLRREPYPADFNVL